MSLTHAICMRITFTVQFPCWWKQFCLKLTGNLQGVWGVCFHAALLSKCIMNHYLKSTWLKVSRWMCWNICIHYSPDQTNKRAGLSKLCSVYWWVILRFTGFPQSLLWVGQEADRGTDGWWLLSLKTFSFFFPIILLLNLCLSHKKIHNCHQVRIFFFQILIALDGLYC